MSLLKRIFGGKGAAEPQVEVVENKLCTDVTRYQVRVRKHGQEMYAEELFRLAVKPKDLQFGRFYLLNENPPMLHFAPSLDQALSWFRGRDLPKDGYYNIFWGDKLTYHCSFCTNQTKEPLTIAKVEQLTVFTNVPVFKEIMGWRVVEVATDLMGRGIPSKIMDLFKTKPVVKWHSGKNKYICEVCAQKLREMGQEADLEEYQIF